MSGSNKNENKKGSQGVNSWPGYPHGKGEYGTGPSEGEGDAGGGTWSFGGFKSKNGNADPAKGGYSRGGGE